MTNSTARVLGMAVALAAFNAGGLAHAQITIVPTFDSTITNDINAVAIENGINAMIARVASHIANPITVNITYEEMTGGLGESTTFIGTIPYGPANTAGTYLNAITTKQTRSAIDNIGIASLGSLTSSNNPVNGNASVTLTTPLLRALGFSGFNVSSDSTIGLNTSIMNLSRTGPQNSSFYDLQAVAGHETDEVLGIGGPGSVLPTTTGSVGVLDLYRYKSPGVRSFTATDSPVPYFSLDGGTTDLVHFNQFAGADYADWGNGVAPAQQAGNSPAQMQDAFGTTGANGILNIGANELAALDVVGYNLALAPEPGTLALTAAGLAATTFFRRRRAAAIAA